MIVKILAVFMSLLGFGFAYWSLNETAIIGSQLAVLSVASFAFVIVLGVWRIAGLLEDDAKRQPKAVSESREPGSFDF